MMANKEAKLSAQTMGVFMIMNFTMSLSGTLFNGILDRIALEMGISVAQTGYLTSMYAYGAIGAPVLLALLRNAKRNAMLVGTLLGNIVFGLFSIVALDFFLLLAARFGLGLMGTTYGVVATTSVVALSDERQVGRNLSLLITGAAVSLMAGVPLCRVLIRDFSWQSINFALIVIMGLGVLYFVFCLPTIKASGDSLHLKQELAMLKERRVLLVVLGSLITFVGYGAFYTYVTPYLVERFPLLEPYMSGLLVLIGACCFLGNLFGGVVCDKIGFEKAWWIGSVLQTVLGAAILVSQRYVVVNALFVLVWMFNGWFIGLQLNTGINLVTGRKSNLVVSINNSIIQFAQALGASIAAVVIARAGISMDIVISIVTSAGAVALILLLSGGRIIKASKDATLLAKGE
ncbi:MFS transporter [uncultured Dubosiella sp.]|uniref:MFS transporter n=1 Tax=uncultured Dubosiella sp. TaxID=1937011 RepID=UPI0025B0CAAC|nr:MFS transporter [uncultured Dubosiella sp.]